MPFDTPRTQQWNIGVQRQLYPQGFIDVSYVGSRGDDLIQPVDINLPQPADVVAADGNLNLVRPFLGYGTITMRQTTAYSNYWGLLTQFRHDQGRDGTLPLNYTLSGNRTTATNDRDAIDLHAASTTAATTVDLNRCDDIGETDTFGQLTGARAPREIQLSFKLYW